MHGIVHFVVGDTLELSKPHPCGCSHFTVLRTGSTVRIVCTKCGRDMTMGREKLDRAVKCVISPPHTDIPIQDTKKQDTKKTKGIKNNE